MKKLLLLISFSLIGCSSIDGGGVLSSLELEDALSSEQEAQRILDLGLSHEESLVEAGKLETPHMIAVVTLQLNNARDAKIQSEIDLKEANEYAEKVIVTEENSKFISSEISEKVKNGILGTDIDQVIYNLEGSKDLNSGLIRHRLELSLVYNSKNSRNYDSVKFCDKWNNCDDKNQKINVLSITASGCKKNSCDFTEILNLDLTEDFLYDSIDKGFSMRLMSKKKTIKIILSKPYLMGYLKVAHK
tara:strand:- start:435 stop:1172 length:738 start_codon:yes stop_codon:yes gene_type:complete